jgi:hypothetical protein
MKDALPYQVFADIILVLHVVFVLFVIFALPFIFIGKALHWRWVRNLWFRLTHVIAIGAVVIQAWIGVLCPLTTIEARLRVLSGQETYRGTFIQFWLHKLLYYDAPMWVFSVIYTLFGLAVLLSWLLVPPEQRNHNR